MMCVGKRCESFDGRRVDGGAGDVVEDVLDGGAGDVEGTMVDGGQVMWWELW